MGDFLKDVMKNLDLKNMGYELMNVHVLPAVKKAVDDSDSKIDDVIYMGIAQMVEVFLKPKA